MNDAPTKDYRPGWIQDFLISVVFLTRLPVPLDIKFSMAAVGSASRCFPLVGVIVGGISGAVFYGAILLNLPLLLCAFLALAAQVVLTGALHEDAIGDVADGFGGGATKDKKLEIMRDSRVGTYAVVTLILVMGMKAAVLSSFNDPNIAFSVIVSSAVASRGMLTWGMYLLAPASDNGLGASAGKPALITALWALFFTILLPLLVLGPFLGSIGILAAIVGAVLISGIALRQIGGQTGDVLGSIQQFAELFFLIALSAVIT